MGYSVFPWRSHLLGEAPGDAESASGWAGATAVQQPVPGSASGLRVSILRVLRLRDGVPAFPLPPACASRGQRWAGGGTETFILRFGPGLLYLLLPEPRTGVSCALSVARALPPWAGGQAPASLHTLGHRLLGNWGAPSRRVHLHGPEQRGLLRTRNGGPFRPPHPPRGAQPPPSSTFTSC